MPDDITTRMGGSCREMLKELYRYYTLHRRSVVSADDVDEYLLGKFDGKIETVEMMILMLYGGQTAFEIWQEFKANVADIGVDDDEGMEGIDNE